MSNVFDFSNNGDISIVISGEAGQGIKTVEHILSTLITEHGLNVFCCKEYMSRVRGGLNSTQIRISKNKVKAWVDRIDILIPLNPDLSRLVHRISDKTLIIGEKNTKNAGQSVIDFSFETAALAAGNKIYSNIVAAGLIMSLFHVDRSLLDNHLRKSLPKNRKK